MIRHDEAYYKARKPRKDLGNWKNFKRFVRDKDRGTFLDRSSTEWLNLGFFYMCFFTVLGTFTYLQLYTVYKFLTAHNKPYGTVRRSTADMRSWDDPDHRGLFLGTSLISRGPGIELKPNLLPEAPSPLVLIDESEKNSKRENHVNVIKAVLEEYSADKSKFDMGCSDRELHHDAAEQKPCYFDVRNLGYCSQAPFGYTANAPQPCLYIVINKRFSWMPHFYTRACILPEDMPKWLKSTIRQTDKFYVWLSCEGASEEDRKRTGEIEYLPAPGFPVQYFPFAGQVNYLSPMVALHFKNLTVNHIVNVECKIWTKNIDNENALHLNFRILMKVKN